MIDERAASLLRGHADINVAPGQRECQLHTDWLTTICEDRSIIWRAATQVYGRLGDALRRPVFARYNLLGVDQAGSYTFVSNSVHRAILSGG